MGRCPQQALAYATLFGWSFLAATIVPLGSEPALVALIARGYSVPTVVAVATVGNYLGACTTYGSGEAPPARSRRGTPPARASGAPQRS